jgi:asparagine synthase (glutamine-hydrolysing)
MLATLLKNIVPYRTVLSKLVSGRNRPVLNPQFIARYEKMLELLRVRTVADLIRLMNEKAWTNGNICDFLAPEKEEIFKSTVIDVSHLHDQKDDLFDLMMRTDYKLFLRDDILTKVDRASMAVSLECRDPMLDHRIAEFAFSLPIDFLYKNGEHKRILKTILRKSLSEDIVGAPKRGFMIPLYYWLKGAWKPIVLDYLAPQKIRAVGFLDEKKVGKELEQFYRYSGCRGEKIWMMLSFQMWAEKWYLSGAISA